MNPQRLFYTLYTQVLLTDFEAVARDFASTSNKLFCYSSHMQIISFMYLLLFISENIQNVKSSPPAGRERKFFPSQTHPMRRKERVYSFFLPLHLKKSSYGPDRSALCVGISLSLPSMHHKKVFLFYAATLAALQLGCTCYFSSTHSATPHTWAII